MGKVTQARVSFVIAKDSLSLRRSLVASVRERAPFHSIRARTPRDNGSGWNRISGPQACDGDMAAMSVQTHGISINLRALEVKLSLNIQRVSHFVLAALGASREVLHSPLVANGRVVGFGYSPHLRWSRDEADQEYDNWILQTGFRDLAEVTIPFLQVVQSLSATALLKELQDANEQITPAQWREIVVDGERRFEKANLPDKLTTLQNAYGLDFPADCLTQILSIARARSCLVHRGGVVQTADVDEAGVLRVS